MNESTRATHLEVLAEELVLEVMKASGLTEDERGRICDRDWRPIEAAAIAAIARAFEPIVGRPVVAYVEAPPAWQRRPANVVDILEGAARLAARRPVRGAS